MSHGVGAEHGLRSRGRHRAPRWFGGVRGRRRATRAQSRMVSSSAAEASDTYHLSSETIHSVYVHHTTYFYLFTYLNRFY